MNTLKLSRAITAALLILFTGISPALNAQNLPLDPAVRTGKLPNGFTYFIRHNTEPKHRVVMYLVNKAGSILEDDDQRGLAHFMEHMSFNGTAHFPKNTLVDYLQKSGVRFGADLNAYTSFDETVYQLPIPSDKPELLANGIEIMRDWAQEATLDPEEINKERGVVLEEKRLGKGAGERMQRVYLPMLLNNSRYSDRLPIGLDTVLNNFKPEVISRFYHDWYRPDMQALIIVGDVDVNAIEQKIKEQFSSLKNPENEKARTKYSVPLTGKNQFAIITDKENSSTTAEVMIKHRQVKFQTAAGYRNRLINQLFNQMIAGRCAELSRQPNTPFIGLGIQIGGFIGGLDSYSASVTAKPGELEKSFKAMWRESERIKRLGFTQTELDRAKSGFINSFELGYKERDKTQSDSYVAEYQKYFLDGEPAPGIDVEYKLVKEAIPGITLKDFSLLTAEYISPVNRDILIMSTDKEKASMPDEATVNSWMKAVEDEKLVQYDDQVNTMPLLAHQPKPGKITKSQQNKALGITTLTLSNGLKVILKPTDFSNNEMMIQGIAPGGTSRYSDADFQSAKIADNIVPNGGVGNYNLTQLGKFLQDKHVGVDPFIIERFQGINAQSATNELETALQLVYGYFTEPRKDTAGFTGMVQRMKAGIANRANNPGQVFHDTLWAATSNYNVRRTGPTLKKFNQINFEKAFAIYKERFADASQFTFTFVGAFDMDKIKPLLEKYLASLPSTYKNEKAVDIDIHPIEGKVTKIIRMGNEPKATVEIFFSGRFEYTAENKIKLDAMKEALQIRLLQRLREEEGGVYAPSIFAIANKYPVARQQVFIRFGCSPQNVDKLIASTLEEISKLRTDGPPQENVDKWRAEKKASDETEQRSNGMWLSYFGSQIQDNGDFMEIKRKDALIDKVTPADVKEMAVKYLSGDNLVKIELLPESAPKPITKLNN